MTAEARPPLPQGPGIEVSFNGGQDGSWCVVTLQVLPRVGDHVEFTMLEDDSTHEFVVERLTWFLDLPDGLDPDVADSGKVLHVIAHMKKVNE